MLRSSVWGGKVAVELSNVPTGFYQVFVHVWEDNNNESYDLLLDDRTAIKRIQSGPRGSGFPCAPRSTGNRATRARSSQPRAAPALSVAGI
jgi:hypothetical protein